MPLLEKIMTYSWWILCCMANKTWPSKSYLIKPPTPWVYFLPYILYLILPNFYLSSIHPYAAGADLDLYMFVLLLDFGLHLTSNIMRYPRSSSRTCTSWSVLSVKGNPGCLWYDLARSGSYKAGYQTWWNNWIIDYLQLAIRSSSENRHDLTGISSHVQSWLRCSWKADLPPMLNGRESWHAYTKLATKLGSIYY